jgi:hypothetical protein
MRKLYLLLLQHRYICFVLIMFAVFALNGCRDLFHSQPDIGAIRVVNSSSFTGCTITRVTIYKWGSSEREGLYVENIGPLANREFTLSSGEYRVVVNSSYRSGSSWLDLLDVTSEKITVTKGKTAFVHYDPVTGTYDYP